MPQFASLISHSLHATLPGSTVPLQHEGRLRAGPHWRTPESCSYMDSRQCLDNRVQILSRVSLSHMYHTTGNNLSQRRSLLLEYSIWICPQYQGKSGTQYTQTSSIEDKVARLHATSLTVSLIYGRFCRQWAALLTPGFNRTLHRLFNSWYTECKR